MARPVKPYRPKSVHLVAYIAKETMACVDMLKQIASPKKRNRDALDAVEAKLDETRKREELEVHHAEKKRLELDYESGLKDAEADYRDEANGVVKTLAKSLNTTLKEIESCTTERIPNPAYARSVNGDIQDASQNRPAMHAMPLPENNQASGTPVDSTIPPADEPSHKRRASSSRSPPPKRQRGGVENRTIPFNEVFQNGNAPIKRLIVRYPPDDGRWYIIRCRMHDIDFKENPLKAGSRHICRSKHPNKSRDYGSVIRLMGYEILDCDEALAEQNNAVAREAFGFGTGNQPRAADSIEVRYNIAAPVPEESFSEDDDEEEEEGSGGDRLTPTTCSSSWSRTSNAITNPTPGEVYVVYWRMWKKWLAALLLPLENLNEVGVPESIGSLELRKRPPRCYTYDSLAKTFQWSKGYENGGKWASKREFPVVFFNELPFSSKSEVAWVAAKDLRPCEAPRLDLVENRQQVLEFLASQRRTEPRAIEEEPEVGDSHRLESHRQTVQPNSTISTEDDTTSGSIFAPIEKSRTNSRIVIDLTGEDSSSDEESILNQPAQEQPADSATDKEPGTATDSHQGESEEINNGESAISVTGSTTMERPSPVADDETSLPIPDQPEVPGLQPTSFVTPEVTEVAQIACSLVEKGESNIEPQPPPRQGDEAQTLQHSHPQGPHRAAYYIHDSPDLQENQRPQALAPASREAPMYIHPVHSRPQPQSMGSGLERLPELRIRTNQDEIRPARLPSIRNLLDSPQLAGLSHFESRGVMQSPVVPLSPYSPGCSIQNQLRTHEMQPHPAPANASILSPQLAPSVATFRSGSWLLSFNQHVAEQLQLASGSPVCADPRDFMDDSGRLQCPFCRICVIQLDHFIQHLQYPCRRVSAVQISSGMSAAS